MSLLRTSHYTVRFFNGRKAHHTISVPIRHSPYYLSQQPDASTPTGEPTASEPLDHSMAVYCPGFHCKPPKELL